MGILDFFFPKHCVSCKKGSSYLCTDCFSRISFDTKEWCVVCQKPAISGLTHPKCEGKYTIDGVFASIAYSGIVKKLIYQFKYKPFLTDLQTVLLDLFYEGIIQNEAFYILLQDKSVFVPVPLHRAKMRSRGYNQAEILAKGLAKRFSTITKDLLVRTRQTKSQYGLKKEERIENIRGVFAIKKPLTEQEKAQTVFLVDDILTTGSTMLEGAKMLKKAGIEKVYGLALARD